jgi:hypothetical protein
MEAAIEGDNCNRGCDQRRDRIGRLFYFPPSKSGSLIVSRRPAKEYQRALGPWGVSPENTYEQKKNAFYIAKVSPRIKIGDGLRQIKMEKARQSRR